MNSPPRAQSGKRLPRGGTGIAEEAIRRLMANGREVTVRAVVGELKRWRLVGMSLRDATAVVREWRRQHLAENGGLIDAAEAAVLSLRTNVLRDELTRRVADATGGEVTLSFNVKARIKRPAKTGIAKRKVTAAK